MAGQKLLHEEHIIIHRIKSLVFEFVFHQQPEILKYQIQVDHFLELFKLFVNFGKKFEPLFNESWLDQSRGNLLILNCDYFPKKVQFFPVAAP